MVIGNGESIVVSASRLRDQAIGEGIASVGIGTNQFTDYCAYGSILKHVPVSEDEVCWCVVVKNRACDGVSSGDRIARS